MGFGMLVPLYVNTAQLPMEVSNPDVLALNCAAVKRWNEALPVSDTVVPPGIVIPPMFCDGVTVVLFPMLILPVVIEPLLLSRFSWLVVRPVVWSEHVRPLAATGMVAKFPMLVPDRTTTETKQPETALGITTLI